MIPDVRAGKVFQSCFGFLNLSQQVPLAQMRSDLMLQGYSSGVGAGPRALSFPFDFPPASSISEAAPESPGVHRAQYESHGFIHRHDFIAKELRLRAGLWLT